MFRKKEKDDIQAQPYTKKTFGVQIIMTVAAIAFIAPIFIILNYSFKGKRELYLSSPLSLPESFNLENYVKAFDKLNLATTFTNTFIYTAISVLILAILCGTTAWAIARCTHKFFKFCYIYFIVGILIPYQALFLPIYMIGYKLHLTNTRYGIIFMYVATGVSFGVFLMNSFMSTVPLELEEAARIDGCSVIRTYISVVMPILKPAMATLIIMQAFQIWNDYLLASLYVSKKQLKTLTVAIQSLFSAQSSDYTTAMAAIVISVLPIAILFLSLQKYFIKGMTVGAVKG
ncbi:carbohydrate ABC transporter permease [Lactonifactor longoviformis]|uniref:Raffinose/stachyose/melibiose transport system permease protein n=1 Tax=Lactonifactor longoviformis DSM 17459 TaxID=1122155 RepID=A0A1M4Y4U4_9CLOT|nr:carbohydrate ABC transporter permease [Lactonifactor longoviformis]POP31876.1 carbohydrate ABC transporter permease [Lactonifactor longoviformis]SHF00781.1 raffinose/stachyose/melibiose transport system permease protein [Lactonifactor longoviformis DSM 17459]